jgi:phytoene dehydrogenase-like protein
MTPGELFNILSLVPTLAQLNKLSVADYARQFTHPGIQRLFHFVPQDHSSVSLIFTLSLFNTGDGGYPEGGSLAMVEKMVKTFNDRGGTLRLNTKVKKIKIEHGAAVGVVLSSESETQLAADAVIVTQDTITAYDQSFDHNSEGNTPPQDRWLQELRKNTKPETCTFVSAGIRAKIPETPVLLWRLDEPIRYAGKTLTEISFFNYARFQEYMPAGCSVLTGMLIDDTYGFWKKAKEEGRYEEEKRALADQISRAICRKYPQAENNIEVIDIATPLTYERYTGAYHGSWMGKICAGDKIRKYPGYSKYISGLYFAGQRIHSPGGLPVTLDTGRKAAQMVCRRFGVTFK